MSSRSGVRPEIQALRAAAVVSVVVYHLWPGRLTGGFVGVDVFFVISGFLITAHLIREVDRTGRISLPQFWARRARRLLPASLLVLVATALLVVAFVPQSYWLQFFREIGAATLYVENWQLAADAVDYLAADNAASPVQHFWSLSVEEQFYVVWPLFVLAAVVLSGRRATAERRRLFVGVALGLITAASLVFSIVWTAEDAASAYFITPTRAWEFGAGGLLGIFSTVILPAAARSELLRTVVSWLGWAIIGISVVTYSVALPFPGFVAIVPVVGTLAVIWAGAPTLRWSPTWLASLRPVQFLGDISYSLYLWHWPLIVIAPFVLGELVRGDELGWRPKLVIALLALVLAYLTKILVEDPVRSRGFFATRSPRFTFVGMVVAMALVVAALAGGSHVVQRQVDENARLAAQLAASDVRCFGAAGVDPDCVEPQLDGVLVPSPIPRQDRGDAFDDRCILPRETAEPKECHYGSDDPDATVVALVGDSHAAMWLPALQQVAETENWRIELFLKNGCAYTAALSDASDPGFENCEKWKTNVDAALAGMSDLSIVVTSYRSGILPADRVTATAGFEEKWHPLVDRGIEVYAIADIPQMEGSGVACVDLNQRTEDYSDCAVKQEKSFMNVQDVQREAAEKVGANYIDLNNFLCTGEECLMVVGHVMTFYDRYHVTATFARTVGPFLAAEMGK